MTENELIKQRIEKIKLLKERGINPYPYKFDRKNYSDEILKKYKNLKKDEVTNSIVKVAGRLVTKRIMGKASFGHIQDQNGRIQFYIREDDVGKENYSVFKKLIDIGDFIGIEGNVFRTKMGEISVWTKKYVLLCKAIRTLPEKWHGLQDPEIRHRHRCLDLIMNPDVKKVFILRGKIISAIREYFEKNGFLEVEIPLLQPVYGGAKAKPFKTYINAFHMDMYLSISPELYLKRAVVGGLENVYTICKNFRNEGVDKTHNPEFTMMECYSAYKDYEDMMKITEEIYNYVAKKVLGTTKIEYQGKKINLSAPWKRLTMIDAIKKYAGVNIKDMADEEIKKVLEENRIELEEGYNRGLAIEAIFEELVQPKIIQPTFITNHPKETSPLCKQWRKDPDYLERFEPFINGCEVGNGYTELNDPILQRKLMVEQAKKLKRGLEAHPLDEDFLIAMEYGMPPTGGLGLGIDRMVMFLTNAPSIRETIMFPTVKPREKTYSET